MKKVIILIMLLGILVMGGCKKEDKDSMKFGAENKNWTAEYKIDPVNTYIDKNGNTITETENTLTVNYKHSLSDLSSIKELKILYDDETQANGGEFSISLKNNKLSEKNFVRKFKNEAVIINDKNSIIKVSIELDGKVEKLELKYKS